MGVQFWLDGSNLGTADTFAPYVVTWNIATANNGLHTLTAMVWDADNQATSSPVKEAGPRSPMSLAMALEGLLPVRRGRLPAGLAMPCPFTG